MKAYNGFTIANTIDILLWLKKSSHFRKKEIVIDLAYLIIFPKRAGMENRIAEIVDEMGEV